MKQKYHWQCESGSNFEFLFVALAVLMPFLALVLMLLTLIMPFMAASYMPSMKW
jgi:hypothetical protein